MNDESEKIWKVGVVWVIDVLSLHRPGKCNGKVYTRTGHEGRQGM